MFVPALPALFSEFDKSIGHYRRYRKSSLVDTLQGSGFSIVKIKYFDFAGILPWYVSFVLLKKILTGINVALYDKAIVPVMRTIESLITPSDRKKHSRGSKKGMSKPMSFRYFNRSN